MFTGYSIGRSNVGLQLRCYNISLRAGATSVECQRNGVEVLSQMIKAQDRELKIFPSGLGERKFRGAAFLECAMSTLTLIDKRLVEAGTR